MDVETLMRLTAGALRGEVPLEACQTAAMELEPPAGPLLWRDWLDRSGMLRYLGECLHFVAGGFSAPAPTDREDPDPHSPWPASSDLSHEQRVASQELGVVVFDYRQVCEWCRALAVPPVSLEVDHSRPYPGDGWWKTAWGPASPELAREVLVWGLSVGSENDLEMYLKRAHLALGSWGDQLPKLVRNHDPRTQAFRVRVGDSPWVLRWMPGRHR